MNPEVRRLFHELADQPAGVRERILTERRIAPELRAELESLFQFDSSEHAGLTTSVSDTARNILHSVAADDGRQCGPYRLARLLGSGGMGSVYLAERTDGEIQQTVAIKLLRAEEHRSVWRERFLKERQLLASLHHPSIVQLIDAGHTDGGRPDLVMEYVDGKPIDEYAAGFELRQRLALFLRVCDGVAYAHSHLIIHRDLKPSNILVDAGGQPKVLDFGIAKLLDETGDPTQTAERLLTPNYASPEQIRGAAQSTATDVYSLGAVLYKLVTGRSPHETDAHTSQAIEIVAGTKQIATPSRVVPGLPADLDFILGKALRNEPEARYPSVEALAGDVGAFLQSRPVQARAGDTWYRARKFLRRYWLPLAAAVLIVLALSIGLFIANRERAIAQRRFLEVRQLANKLIALDADIRNLPGSTKARSRIVSTSLEYLAALGPEARGYQDLSLEIGDAYAELARIQGVPIHSNLGQFADAKESLRKAAEFVDAALASQPGNHRALLVSAQIAHDRMAIATVERNLPGVLAESPKTELALGRLARQPDLRPDEIRQMAAMYSNVAISYANAHRFEDCIRAARHALDISSGVPAARASQGLAIGALSSGLRYTGDLDGALETVRESRRMLESNPEPGIVYQLNLIEALYREGRILGEDAEVSLNRPQDAIVVLQKSLDLAEALAARDPNDTASRHRVAGSALALGDILRHTDPSGALTVFDLGLSRTRQIANNLDAQRDEAWLLADSSYALRRVHRGAEAAQRIENALQILRNTKDYPAARVELIDVPHAVLRALADHYAETGQLLKAAAVYSDLRAKAIASVPDHDSDLRNAAYISYDQFAEAGILRRLGRSQDAEEIEARRRQLWQRWDQKLPNNPFVRRQLALAVRP